MRTRQELQKLKKNLEENDGSLVSLFQALADPSRLNIIRILLRHKNICVTEIAHILHISVPAASQQLRFLELSGIIQRNRNGQMICYEMRTENTTINSIIKIFSIKK